MNLAPPPSIETQPTLPAELFWLIPEPLVEAMSKPQGGLATVFQDHSQQVPPPSPERVPSLLLLVLLPASHTHASAPFLGGGFWRIETQPCGLLSLHTPMPGVQPGAIPSLPLQAWRETATEPSQGVHSKQAAGGAS